MTARANDVPVTVLGAGSWGTALAVQFARSGRSVRLWGRDRERLATLAAGRRYERHLPGVSSPDALRIEPQLPAAVSGALDVLVVVPSHALRALLSELAAHLSPTMHVAWAAKGFE